MRRRLQENLIAAGLLVIFGGVLWLCQDFGPRARMIPLPLAIFGLVLTAIQIVWQNVRSTDELKMDLITVSDRAIAQAVPPGPKDAAAAAGARDASWRLELKGYGLVALLIALFLMVGIMPAVFIFTAGYFILSRQYSWLAGLIYASAFGVCIYVLFFAALQIEPYHGLLAPLAERFR
jgi:hypothetical protein